MMRRFSLFASLVGCGLLFGAAPLLAHHSPGAVFDMQNKFTQQGELTQVEWVNPHIILHVDVKDSDGKVTPWTFESHPPSFYKNAGMTKSDVTRGVGQNVTIVGMRARDGSHFGYMLKIVFADGKTIEWKDNLDDIKPKDDASASR